jgi:hypothetical protein
MQTNRHMLIECTCARTCTELMTDPLNPPTPTHPWCRAPVLVAVALVESGMPPLDAIDFVRTRRRGAVNTKQLRWVEAYRPRAQRGSCVVQ